MTLAARPVGANKTYFLLTSNKLLTKVEITVVFPVPAYPFNTKTSCSFLLVTKSAICCKKMSCFTVG